MSTAQNSSKTYLFLDEELSEIRNEDHHAEEIESLDRSDPRLFRFRSISDTPDQQLTLSYLICPYIDHYKDKMEYSIMKRLLVIQFLYGFYAGTFSVPIHSRNYRRVYCSYLTLIKSLSTNYDENAIKELFAKEKILVSYRDDKTAEMFGIETKEFNDSFNKKVLDGEHENLIFVIFGIALLTIGRYPAKEDYKDFQIKKAEELCEQFGIEFSADLFKKALIPFASAKLAYLAMSSTFEFRREVFKFLLSYIEDVEDEFKVVFAYVMESLKYTLMTHVLLIEKYLIQKFPGFMPCQTVNFHVVKNNMMEFLEKHKDVKPFIPFFVPYNERTAINPNTLHFLIISAQVFSERFNPTTAFRYHSDIECEFTSAYARPTVNRYFNSIHQGLFEKSIRCYNINL